MTLNTKEELMHTRADLALAYERLDGYQEEIIKLTNLVTEQAAKMAEQDRYMVRIIRTGARMIERRDRRIELLQAGDKYRASVIAEYRDRLQQAGALDSAEKPAVLELAA